MMVKVRVKETMMVIAAAFVVVNVQKRCLQKGKHQGQVHQDRSGTHTHIFRILRSRYAYTTKARRLNAIAKGLSRKYATENRSTFPAHVLSKVLKKRPEIRDSRDSALLIFEVYRARNAGTASKRVN